MLNALKSSLSISTWASGIHSEQVDAVLRVPGVVELAPVEVKSREFQSNCSEVDAQNDIWVLRPAVSQSRAMQLNPSKASLSVHLRTRPLPLSVQVSRVQVTDDGTTWVDLEATMTSQREWVQKTFAVGDYVDLTAAVRFRFVAEDAGSGSIVEALVDDFALSASSLIADATAPTVTLTYPNGGQVFGADDEVMVAWSASDDTGIVQARVYLDVAGQPLLLAAGALNGSYRFVWSEHFDAAIQRDAMVGRFRVVVLDGAQRQAADSSDGDVTFDYSTPVEELPAGRFELAQNHPNPFNPRTEIRFAIPRAEVVSLRIYDVRGQLVRTLVQGMQPAGTATVVWSGDDDSGDQVASGLYFYRLVTDDGEQTRKMLLVK